jgi:hypothetical protein
MTAHPAQLMPVARTGATGGGRGGSPPLASTAWQWLQSAVDMAALLSGYWPVEPDASSAPPGNGLAGRALPGRWSSTPLVATRTPPPVPSSVAAARSFTLRTLQRWGTSYCAEDAAAVVSELLTNALRHALGKPGSGVASSPIRLGLLHPGPCVLCAVADPSSEVPLPRQPDWEAETGRGLQVVASLSHRWGYCPAPDQRGKVVWATILTSPGLR